MISRGALAMLLSAAVVSAPVVTAGGWPEARQADVRFDLRTARASALEAVKADPLSADAVASAVWWLRHVDNLPEPAAVVAAATMPRDPELGFVVERITARLEGRPPGGTLAAAELSGPFGVFDVLDLDRDVVPPDEALPPLGTPWRSEAAPFRLTMQSADGTVRVPEEMFVGGVYLAAWTLRLDDRFDGWIAVEAEGSLNIVVDGVEVGRPRWCGRVDPRVNWYRARLDAGDHRLRIEMAATRGPSVRVSLFDSAGSPVEMTTAAGAPQRTAASEVVGSLPPASAALEAAADRRDQQLQAATLAFGRDDPVGQRRWIEGALATSGNDAWANLEMAWFLLTQPTGADQESDARDARDHLLRSRELPGSLLVERAIAISERRPEDVERILGLLVENHRDDVRVLRLWIREAVRRGWAREAEAGMLELAEQIPGARSLDLLQLEVLRALERWDERNRLLVELAERDLVEPEVLEELAAGCLVDSAVAALQRLRNRVDDPTLDEALIRMQLGRGEVEAAAAEIAAARRRWGDLGILDRLELFAAASATADITSQLEAALDRDPSDVELRTLAWRRGEQPFFEPFRVDLNEVVEREDPAADVDVVLLLDQAVERVFADGSSVYYYHGVSRALTPVGARQAATLQQLPDALLLGVRIIKPNGDIVVPPELDERNGTMVLRDVRPGDLVEEEYVARVTATGTTRRGHLPPYVYRFADPERAFGLSEFVLLVPPGIEPRVDGNFEGLEREEWSHGELRALRWRSSDVPPVYSEPFSPPAQELLPWMNYGFGVTWQDVGDAFRDRALAMLRSNRELEDFGTTHLSGEGVAAVSELTKAIVEEVEGGRSVMSLSGTAGESFSRRRGNRLGILSAVLLSSGWDVDLVLARPNPFAGSHLEVPTLEAFTEPLLRVRHGEEEVWVDLEEERGGVDHIRPILQGSDALVLPLSRPEQPVSLLDELPTFSNPELVQSVRVAAAVEPSGDARLRFEMPIYGAEAEQMLERADEASSARGDALFQQMASTLFPGARDVSAGVERVEDGALLSFDTTVPGACEASGDALICRSLVLARPLVPAFASLPSRRFPLVIYLPLEQHLELEIAPPEGMTANRTPRRLATRWGSVDEQLEVENGKIRSILTIRVPAQTVSPEEYAEFARFCRAVDELISRPPKLQPTAG